MGLPQGERLKRLNQIAIRQIELRTNWLVRHIAP